VPARRRDHARAELDGIDRVEIDELHLDDLDSVRRSAERFLASGPQARPPHQPTPPSMATRSSGVGPRWEGSSDDHLGHYVPPNLLWPALTARAAARA